MNFKELLDTLSLSSPEAVVNGETNSFDDLKRYLHIERTVEQDLSNLIMSALTTSYPQLIFIIGNVGDGKSHLLARMWEKHPVEMNAFYVHNDATESKSIHKTYLETLRDVLLPFSDNEIGNISNTSKTIIAINLGTLTNFLHEKGNEFNCLRNFIESNGILQDSDQRSKEDRYIKYINLADYHLYSLSEDGPFSTILNEIICKITQKTEKNPFYQAYKNYYKEHSAPDKCPLKYNYDLLGETKVKDRIIQIIIEAIIKYKLIVSVRLMLNLLYDLIVPPKLSTLSEKEILKECTSIKSESIFYKWTLPWLLFESTSTSPILKQIAELDPVGKTTEEMDQLVIKMGTTSNPNSYFFDNKLLTTDDPLTKNLADMLVFDRLKLFIRLNYIKGTALELIQLDTVYYEFMKNLYFFHAHHTSKLFNLYQKAQKAIFQWNGMLKMGEDYLNIDIGRRQNRYRISQKVKLELRPGEIKTPVSGPINRFSSTITLGFKVMESPETYYVKVDYGLFLLLSSINLGYRANLIDKSNHVDFKQFVSKLSSSGAQNKDVIIQDMHGVKHEKFKLVFTPGFDIFHFEEIK
ncbi:DNA phosphorothioation-dependent restriction protein DptF [Spirosoma panaciterrae]|uniref:DNA phosphorothioation-dependent restriction protein DptF n=1 Tax=Spirosoma panaciterrae TaxID=496058 RepID=UPI0003740D27|nr:DNA phosphorothioation-dependent restriction protein DptF [Spirosoma panaciterrae]